jgi:zinc transport system permease protein
MNTLYHFITGIGQFDFLRNAIAAGVLVSIACGIIGLLVTVNRIVFISGGIAHTAYGGIGIAIYFGQNPVIGAFLFSLIAAFGMGSIDTEKGHRADTVIGIMWAVGMAVGMAVGIIFIDATPGYKADLMTYLFGSILAVSACDLAMMFITDVFIILFTFVFYRQLLAVSWDADFARTRGINIRFFKYAILIMSAMTVVLMMRIVGLIMVIALLTIPAASASSVSHRFGTQMVIAALYGLAATAGGLFFSFSFNVTSGAAIILVSAALYMLTRGITKLLYGV